MAVKELTKLLNKILHEEKVPEPMEERLDSENTQKRRPERVQELPWRDIVTCVQQSNGESHHQENTKRSRPCT